MPIFHIFADHYFVSQLHHCPPHASQLCVPSDHLIIMARTLKHLNSDCEGELLSKIIIKCLGAKSQVQYDTGKFYSFSQIIKVYVLPMEA